MVSVRTMSIACVLLAAVSAAPLESDPVTLTDDVIPLSDTHPAHGAELVEPSMYPVVADPEIEFVPNATEAAARRLEASSRDVQKLESYFGAMERNVNSLPRSSEFTPAPWPGSYWPVYADGINFRWNGDEPSPAEKYARAFNLNVKRFTDNVSWKSGILSQRQRRQCRKNSNDCHGLNDGSVCGVRDGETTGRCIPTWFGVCHAWAPAAILEPEPRCPVTINGVTFRVADIKALITQLYDGTNVPTVFTGARYNGPTDAGKDKYGRYLDAAYRDIGAGFFHIATTNLLGRLQKSFVVDVTAAAEVWNQPVRSYEIISQTRYSLSEGSQRFFQTPDYPFNAHAKKLMHVSNRFRWIVESDSDGPLVSTGIVNSYTRGEVYEYLLELDAQDNIIGGEWLGRSKEHHPDFLWVPVGNPGDSASTWYGLSYRNVKDLLNKSTVGECS